MTIFAALRILYVISLGATCALAFTRGGRSERIGALIVLLGSIATVIVQRPGLFDWRYARMGLVGVDLAVLAAFLGLALHTKRFWPLWATAFHLIAIMTHLMVYLEPRRVLQAYALVQGFWAYPMLLTIIIGCLGRSRRPTGHQPSNPNGTA